MPHSTTFIFIAPIHVKGTCRMPQGLGKHAAGGEKFLSKNALIFKIDHRKSPKIDNFSKNFRLRHLVSLKFNNKDQKFSRAGTFEYLLTKTSNVSLPKEK